MKFIIIFKIYFILSINCKTIEVKTGKELLKALEEVNAGHTIRLNDGDYNDTFVAQTSGTSAAPITLIGSKQAIISGPNYGFWLKANHWVLKGFTITDSKKGIVLDGAQFNILEELTVHNIRQEGIHFRRDSTDNILRHSNIYDTGTETPGYGEGVYIGSAIKNWINNKPDKSDRNQVINNKIGPNVAAEAIDIKEGTCDGIIRGNTFDGTGMSGENSADSWMDVKGENYTIEDNSGENTLRDGIQIHRVKAANMGGCHNTVTNTKCSGLPSNGKCVVNNAKCANTINTYRSSADFMNAIQCLSIGFVLNFLALLKNRYGTF